MDINIFKDKSTIVVSCPSRTVIYLKMELEALGFTPIAESPLSVTIKGTMRDCMKLNLYLRTGHRVLYLINEFIAANPNELYSEVKKMAWEKIMEVDGYFSVLSYTDNPEINDSRFPNLKCKDAIADRFYEKMGKRPDSGSDRHKTAIYLHWKEDKVSLYIDTSGETIGKHGYRKIPFKAPLIESLAASIIMASKWDRNSNFINPMCGSGTLVIEAALMAQNRPSGLLRSNYGFMHVLGFDEVEKEWEEMRREARQASTNKVLPFKIIASDNDEEAIDVAKRNAATAGVDHLIEFILCDYKDTPIPEGTGVVILNPEYGIRMGVEAELEETYKEIGDFFKKSCSGYTGYVFTGNLDLAKKIGLKTKRKIEFYNASIDCRLLEFELYRGTQRV